MNKEEFCNELKNQLRQINIELTNSKCNQFYEYMQLLLQWNEKINLTAITQENDIIQKHFVDSLTISKYINNGDKLIDVGTGAGFPAIPLKIQNDSLNVVLLDALNKRLNFLNEVIEKNGLLNIKTVHARAEEAGKNNIYREKFDVVTSRAVALLNVLVEYLLPFVKVGGKCICMKGNNIEEELENSKNAIKLLGGKIERIDEIYLPNTDIKRNIIIIKKISNTPTKYPRKAGTPSKEPLM